MGHPRIPGTRNTAVGNATRHGAGACSSEANPLRELQDAAKQRSGTISDQGASSDRKSCSVFKDFQRTRCVQSAASGSRCGFIGAAGDEAALILRHKFIRISVLFCGF
jgi:hypothetical protein